MRAVQDLATSVRGSESPAVPQSPPARRGRPPRWRDPRVIGGITVMLVAALAGAVLWSGGQQTSSAWRLVRDLPAGAVLTATDVEAVEVVLPEGTSVAIGPQLPAGRLVRPLLAGELLPVGVTTTQAPADVRLVTIPVEPLHAPVDLAAGSLVDVWATPEADLGGTTAPRLVLPRAHVVSVASDADGVTGSLAVALEVPADRTADVVAAARGGVIDLVGVEVSQ